MTYDDVTNVTEVKPLTYIEQLWNDMLDKTTDSPFIIYCFGIPLVVALMYWTISCFYIYLDLYNPKWVQKFKLQAGKNEPVDRKELLKVLRQVLYNQFIVGPCFTLIAFPIIQFSGICSPEKIRSIPHLHTIVTQITGCIIIREILFYYSHRLMHLRFFYERYHKKHHRWTAPIAAASEYASTIEHIVSNLAPPIIPLLLFSCHLFTIIIFSTHVMLSTLNEHSGYRFPYYYNSERHDKHHESFNQYYGLIGLMDWIHGTNRLKRST